MAANNINCCLGYFNKLVDEYNNTYYCSMEKKPIYVGYSDLIEDIESSHKAPKFKVTDEESGWLSIRIF